MLTMLGKSKNITYEAVYPPMSKNVNRQKYGKNTVVTQILRIPHLALLIQKKNTINVYYTNTV